MSLSLEITNDTIFEGTQSFQLLLDSTSSPYVVIGSNNQATVNISDDEIIYVYFVNNYISAVESDGYAVVGVNASLPSGGTEVEFSVGATVSPGTARGEEHIIISLHTYMSTYRCTYSTNWSVSTVHTYVIYSG